MSFVLVQGPKERRWAASPDRLENTGTIPEELRVAPPCPPEVEHIWRIYRQMGQDRQQGQPITAAMMRDHEWLEGIRLSLWERKAIGFTGSNLYHPSYDDEGAASR